MGTVIQAINKSIISSYLQPWDETTIYVQELAAFLDG